MGKIKIPTLVGMTFMGMLARNLSDYTYGAFNPNWAMFGRVFPLLFILMRGGMEVEL